MIRIHRRDADREFQFTYRFDDAEWGITIFAADANEARRKIQAVALARYDGELHGRITYVPVASGVLATLICKWKNWRKA